MTQLKTLISSLTLTGVLLAGFVSQCMAQTPEQVDADQKPVPPAGSQAKSTDSTPNLLPPLGSASAFPESADSSGTAGRAKPAPAGIGVSARPAPPNAAAHEW